jgi:hypothetical protein
LFLVDWIGRYSTALCVILKAVGRERGRGKRVWKVGEEVFDGKWKVEGA